MQTEIFCQGKEMQNNTMAGFALAAALGLALLGCQDTKVRQENEQLKAHVLQLQKDNGELGNRIDTLTKENAALRDENERLKARHSKTRTQRRKHHRSTSKQTTDGQT
jgi:predicted RNase H-like nuclease (RuvC/YqgF family)